MTDAEKLKCPFPYFGGKSRIVNVVWDAIGNVKHYIEPFFGSGAVLLSRPGYNQGTHVETICDKDGYVANVWRALQADPDEVAKWCDWPVNHADLSARKLRLTSNGESMLDHLISDDKYYDTEMAGYWIWAASCWIGSGLTCIGQIPHVGDAGMGVHSLGQRPHLTDAGMGVREPYNTNIYTWFRQLSERLRYVRVVCGDWTRVCGGNWQDKLGTVGIFFDPPYSHDCGRSNKIYTVEDDVAKDVAKWCYERGSKTDYRIVLAGYDGEHNWLEGYGWSCIKWKTGGGYGNKSGKNNSRGKENCHRERLWLSPNCQQLQEMLL